MRAVNYAWRILILGQRPNKLSSHYHQFCEFPKWISEVDAKATFEAVKKTFPSQRFVVTNREDWNRAFNTETKLEGGDK